IVRAIAEKEYHSFTTVSLTTPPQSNIPADCPGHHGLQLYQTSAAQQVRCNGCKKLLGEGDSVWSCGYHMGCRAFWSTTEVQVMTLPINQRHIASSNSAYSQVSSHYNHPPVASHIRNARGHRGSIIGSLDAISKAVDIAARVGRVIICGWISNVVCAFGAGHVKFLMDFIVLDVSDPLVIIRLVQLRKCKCLVDTERETLIFGGAGGVEVQMLPA
ncbi:hypothetical protein HJC23_007118, partial [Cyclotella cryptica]